MQYKFAQKQDYSIYASGGVFYSLPGHPALPIRLASEIFQRCRAIQKAEGFTKPSVLYDPCCGGAYHLSVLAYLHWGAVKRIIGSDVDAEILQVAERNLGLLTPGGLGERIAELSNLAERYEKPSHKAALQHAHELRKQVIEFVKKHSIQTELFRINATDKRVISARLNKESVDIVISDVPYGEQTVWKPLPSSSMTSESQIEKMLEALLSVITARAVVAIIADKKQQIGHDKYQRMERFQVGKRQVMLLQPYA